MAGKYDEPPIFHCFDQRQKSSMNLSTECVSFMWSKILIDVLTKSYETNPEILQQINNFTSKYKSQDVIYSYTHKSFFYRV